MSDMITYIRCDGCGSVVPAKDLTIARSDGNAAKYCPVCLSVWEGFAGACQAEEARLNRLLDLFIEDIRTKIPLQFVPSDLKRGAMFVPSGPLTLA